jgi:hypothetical protein
VEWFGHVDFEIEAKNFPIKEGKTQEGSGLSSSGLISAKLI